MKPFIFLALVAVAFGAPLEDQLVSVTQSSLGDYKLNIKTAELSRNEERLQNGEVVGQYSYPDENGVIHTIEYVAGKNGFVVTNGLPLPIQETPEVLAERQKHIYFLEMARSGKSLQTAEVVPVVVSQPSQQLALPVQNVPVQIQESPDVVAAKEAHFAAHREARARLGLL